MRDAHARIVGSTVRFEFRGKSRIEFAIDLHDTRIVKACRDLPGYELFQYIDERGERQVIDSADVNAYLREISGEDFTAKDFRTWAGTVLAAKALAGIRQPAPGAKLGATSPAQSSRSPAGWATPRPSAASATSTRRFSTRLPPNWRDSDPKQFGRARGDREPAVGCSAATRESAARQHR